MAVIPESAITFPLFTYLPLEIQGMIWEAALSGPSMHIFDVCFPSRANTMRTLQAFQSNKDLGILQEDKVRYSQFKDMVFLDVLEVCQCVAPGFAVHRVDPSMYRYHDSLESTCTSSSWGMLPVRAVSGKMVHSNNINSVYLPGKNQRIRYNNEKDVIQLRLGDGSHCVNLHSSLLDSLLEPADNTEPRLSSIKSILETLWSPEMADTLRSARHIAFDIQAAQLHFASDMSLIEEIIYLASTIHQNLEVVYLVDYCVGRCRSCRKCRLSGSKLQTRGGMLDLDLHGMTDLERRPDVIQGIGMIYREIFDLEGLGWIQYGIMHLFSKVLGDAIRDQQAESQQDQGVIFKGVRILVAENERLGGKHDLIVVSCGGGGGLRGD